MEIENKDAKMHIAYLLLECLYVYELHPLVMSCIHVQLNIDKTPFGLPTSLSKEPKG
jgi:hypothetical protein